MQLLYVNSTPKTKLYRNTVKIKEAASGRLPAAHPFVYILIFLKFLCTLDLGVEFTYRNRHIISGKYAQELYVGFYMPAKASQTALGAQSR